MSLADQTTWGFWMGLGIGYALGLASFWALVLIMERLGF